MPDKYGLLDDQDTDSGFFSQGPSGAPAGGFGTDFFKSALRMASEPISAFLAGQKGSPPAGAGYAGPGNSEAGAGFSGATGGQPTGAPFSSFGLGGTAGAGFAGFEPLQQLIQGITGVFNPGSVTPGIEFAGAGGNPNINPPYIEGSQLPLTTQQQARQTPAQKRANSAMPSGAFPSAGSIGPMAAEPNRASPHYATAVRAAQTVGIDPEVFARQMSWESQGFDPAVVSGARRSSMGAVGVAQFMPPTAAALGIDPLNPEQALLGAAQHMRDLVKQYGDYRTALIAYNGGPRAVAAAQAGQTWDESRTYLEKVLGTSSPQPPPASLPPTQQAGAGEYATMNGQKLATSFDYGAVYDTPIISDITGQPVTNHRGIDLIVPGAAYNGRGSALGAFQPGVVALVGRAAAAGNYVVIQDAQGLYHWYMHLDQQNAVQGQQVNRGETIGTLGASGTEEFPHLHYEVRQGSPNGQSVDPRPYIG